MTALERQKEKKKNSWEKWLKKKGKKNEFDRIIWDEIK